MLAMGDALALVTSRMRDFGREDFARFHPGGSLGRKLSKVEHHMRALDQCRVAGDGLSVREVFVAVSRPGRRTGAIMLVGADGKLSGIFTDSDLARLFEGRRDDCLDGPIRKGSWHLFRTRGGRTRSGFAAGKVRRRRPLPGFPRTARGAGDVVSGEW